MIESTRILLVEDLSNWQRTIRGRLVNEDYAVRTANSTKESLAILADRQFEVAALDVRLDETDENNRNGLTLMHEIDKRDFSSTGLKQALH